MEADEIDVLASAVLRYLEQVQDTQESRLTCQLRCNVRKTDRFDRFDFDLAFLHTVSRADFYMRAHPYPDAARDLSATNSLTKPLGKHHAENLLLRRPMQPLKAILAGS